MEHGADQDRYVVKMDVFEGPLDLLLHLINTHELDIFDIPISFITTKYLEYLDTMKQFNLDLASDYLEMAATLTLIKSRMLVPSDPAGDDDPTTSDGIFVSGGGYPDEGPRPAVGDSIRIIAQVQEEQYGNALPLTRLRSVALIEVLSSGNPLPAPVKLDDLPDESIADGIAFWEPLEGMLVSVRNAPVVAATSRFRVRHSDQGRRQARFRLLSPDTADPAPQPGWGRGGLQPRTHPGGRQHAGQPDRRPAGGPSPWSGWGG